MYYKMIILFLISFPTLVKANKACEGLFIKTSDTARVTPPTSSSTATTDVALSKALVGDLATKRIGNSDFAIFRDYTFMLNPDGTLKSTYNHHEAIYDITSSYSVKEVSLDAASGEIRLHFESPMSDGSKLTGVARLSDGKVITEETIQATLFSRLKSTVEQKVREYLKNSPTRAQPVDLRIQMERAGLVALGDTQHNTYYAAFENPGKDTVPYAIIELSKDGRITDIRTNKESNSKSTEKLLTLGFRLISVYETSGDYGSSNTTVGTTYILSNGIQRLVVFTDGSRKIISPEAPLPMPTMSKSRYEPEPILETKPEGLNKTSFTEIPEGYRLEKKQIYEESYEKKESVSVFSNGGAKKLVVFPNGEINEIISGDKIAQSLREEDASIKPVVDPSGFIIGGKNSNDTIYKMESLHGIPWAKIEADFRKLHATSSLKDWMLHSNKWVEHLKTTNKELALVFKVAMRVVDEAALKDNEEIKFHFKGNFYTASKTKDRANNSSSPLPGFELSDSMYYLDQNGPKNHSISNIQFSSFRVDLIEKYGIYVDGHDNLQPNRIEMLVNNGRSHSEIEADKLATAALVAKSSSRQTFGRQPPAELVTVEAATKIKEFEAKGFLFERSSTLTVSGKQEVVLIYEIGGPDKIMIRPNGEARQLPSGDWMASELRQRDSQKDLEVESNGFIFGRENKDETISDLETLNGVPWRRVESRFKQQFQDKNITELNLKDEMVIWNKEVRSLKTTHAEIAMLYRLAKGWADRAPAEYNALFYYKNQFFIVYRSERPNGRFALPGRINDQDIYRYHVAKANPITGEQIGEFLIFSNFRADLIEKYGIYIDAYDSRTPTQILKFMNSTP